MDLNFENSCMCWNCGNLGKCPRTEGFKDILECKDFSKILRLYELCDLLKINMRTFYRNIKKPNGLKEFEKKCNSIGYKLYSETFITNGIEKHSYYGVKVTLK